ncbi:hypothetical protein [Roseofilum sp. Guam]|uniref:hypothetical protein n=1 Tax=Roseofilum sp. Guam TaxID=2821502 RepID=UPI001B26B54E|nr:hypothetical protein [Roseofilum sp. Guam]MBP0027754.1 hypothetical protein [Roseofilum sp. Guam]
MTPLNPDELVPHINALGDRLPTVLQQSLQAPLPNHVYHYILNFLSLRRTELGTISEVRGRIRETISIPLKVLKSVIPFLYDTALNEMLQTVSSREIISCTIKEKEHVH